MELHEFSIAQNDFLQQPIKGYYLHEYYRYGQEGNPDYINILKNSFNDRTMLELQRAINLVYNDIHFAINAIADIYSNINLDACIAPRSKAKNTYAENQLLFLKTVDYTLKNCPHNNIFNGLNYITRHTNTCTTHLSKSSIGGGDGDMPYPGIAKNTCTFSHHIKNKNILLIDDIYTINVNIIEDIAQALFNNGAKSVMVLCIARTVKKGNTITKIVYQN